MDCADVCCERPASAGQRGLWFLSHLAPDSPVYNTRLALRLRGPVDIPALRAALDRCVARHEALRTTLGLRDGAVVQRIHAPGPAGLRIVGASGGGWPDAAARARAELDRPFDLEAGPLFRAALVEVGPDDAVLAVSIHHAVMDAWSLGVLLRDVARAYGGQQLVPPAVRAVRPELAGARPDELVAWWRRRLDGIPPEIDLPTDRPRPPVPSFRGALRRSAVDGRLAAGLADTAQRLRATPFVVLLSAFGALVSRWTGQTRLVVATPVTGRRDLELESEIGFFVNTLPIGFDLDDDPAFEQLARRTGAAVLEALSHQEVPLDGLVEAVAPGSDRSRTPLLQVAFSLEPPLRPPALRGLEVEPVDVPPTTAPFDLTLSVRADPTGAALAASYSTDLFDAATVDGLLAGYGTLLGSVVARPDARASELDCGGVRAADRRARDAPASPAGLVAPRTATERAVAGIVSELVGRQVAGVHEKFFEVGGTSLQLVLLHYRLAELCEPPPSVPDLFSHSTVEAIASLVDRARGVEPARAEDHQL